MHHCNVIKYDMYHRNSIKKNNVSTGTCNCTLHCRLSKVVPAIDDPQYTLMLKNRILESIVRLWDSNAGHGCEDDSVPMYRGSNHEALECKPLVHKVNSTSLLLAPMIM